MFITKCFPRPYGNNTSGSSLQKENSFLEKGYYRLVSISPTLSKIFKRVKHHQLSDFLNYHFNDMLKAFRPGYGCQSVLLKFREDWRFLIIKIYCIHYDGPIKSLLLYSALSYFSKIKCIWFYKCSYNPNSKLFKQQKTVCENWKYLY